jgi:hypothetical protein
MPSIFHRLQQRSSRAAEKINGKQDEPYRGEHANGNGVDHRVSSSTLNSSQVDSPTPSTTPATSTTEDSSMEQPKTYGPTPLPMRSPTRAQRPGVEPVKRYSMNVRIFAVIHGLH